MTHEVERIIRRVVDALHRVGVCCVVLGGSRARGTQVEGSDIDIGIYYDDILDDTQLQTAASGLDDQHREQLISPLGGWGPWVNAGGWLVVDGMRVDLILRDIQRVEQVVADCVSGDVSAHYQPGHPHAFINAMYLGELAVCRVLFDPEGRIADLKRKAHPYPPKMSKPPPSSAAVWRSASGVCAPTVYRPHTPTTPRLPFCADGASLPIFPVRLGVRFS